MGSTAASLARRPDGVAIAFAVSSLRPDYNAFLNVAIAALGEAVDAVDTWPEGDLFLAEEPATPNARDRSDRALAGNRSEVGWPGVTGSGACAFCSLSNGVQDQRATRVDHTPTLRSNKPR